VIQKMIEMWDYWIYRKAFHSMRRMSIRDPGLAYLLKLELDRIFEDTPSESLKHSAESFFQAVVSVGRMGSPANKSLHTTTYEQWAAARSDRM